MLTPGQEIELSIHDINHNGEGVGRWQNIAIFVPHTIPGDTVHAVISKVKKKYAQAKPLHIIEKSPKRTTPPCDLFGRCGGCALQHMEYHAQLQYKRELVQQSISRLGGIKTCQVHPVLGMQEPWHYRNKAQLQVKNLQGKLVLGFYEAHSHQLALDFKSKQGFTCYLLDQELNALAQCLESLLNDYKIKALEPRNNTGFLQSILLRKALGTGELMAVLYTADTIWPGEKKFTKELLRRFPALTSFIRHNIPSCSGKSVAAKPRILYGKSTIQDNLWGLQFFISPQSFYQVNYAQTLALYQTTVSYASLSQHDTVVDAYCGIGTISLCLAREAKLVVGLETEPMAIQNARDNAKINQLLNTEFHGGPVEVLLPQLMQQGLQPQAVVLDPPRRGCHPRVLQAIGQANIPKLIYVSCDPGTLARDLGLLTTFDYEVQEIQPIDMFPHTKHVETVVLLGRELEKSREHVYLDYEPSKEIDLPGGATYEQIKAYVLEHTGLKVSHLYIAQVKQKHGIIERECYNKPKSEDAKQPQCPPEKEAAIEAALKHFKMI